jgi:THO complex subunit 3
MASSSTYHEKRTPFKIDKFKATFPKFKLTPYHDTSTPVPRTTNTAILSAQYIRTLSWSPLGNLVATGSGNGKMRVWNPERANVKHSTELRGHTASIERVAWNPVREAELASLSVDGSVRIWDVRSNKNVGQMKIADKEGFSLVWKPDGSEMLIGTKVRYKSH